MLLFQIFIIDFKNLLYNLFPNCNEYIINMIFDYNINQSRANFGDISSNIAILIAKKLKKNPLEIAKLIDKKLSLINEIEKINIIAPGFINIYFKENIYSEYIQNSLTKNDYVKKIESNKKYNIEFVSANPTGPLHIGHGRNAILGDILQRVFKSKGYKIDSEYYINDAGSQIQKLGKSVQLRYKALCGKNITFDTDGYHGEYIIELAENLYRKYENTILSNDIEWFADYAKNILLEIIKNTLTDYEVNFDIWFSEMTLHKSNAITEAIELLNKKGFIYQTEDNTKWFKSTHFGDEKDRVLKKSDGNWTYTAADIAYFLNKINRGYTDIIMIVGQDHHSFKIRMEAIAKAFDFDINRFHIILYQLVTLKNESGIIKMSKRKGNSISLQDIIDTVGSDVARFFYLHRKADAHLDLDINIALEKNSNNPVFYIQYALVRINSICNKIKNNELESALINLKSYQYSNQEKTLLRKINMFNEVLETIIESMEPHILAYYAIELSALFHSFYMNHTIINKDENIAQTRYKITLLTKQILEKCAILLGIQIPEHM